MQAVQIEAGHWEDFEIRYRRDKNDIRSCFWPNVMWHGVHDGKEYGEIVTLRPGDSVELVTLNLMDSAKRVREGFGKVTPSSAVD